MAGMALLTPSFLIQKMNLILMPMRQNKIRWEPQCDGALNFKIKGWNANRIDQEKPIINRKLMKALEAPQTIINPAIQVLEVTL
jgi:hypothetical protein